MNTKRRKSRNQEIYLAFACGITKEDICAKWRLSLTQLNRILREANEEAEEWFKLLPRKTMIQIFRLNCEKILENIIRLEGIRDKVKDYFQEFEMTRSIISTYSQYTKLVAEGPSLTRQKEVVSAAEKLENYTNDD